MEASNPQSSRPVRKKIPSKRARDTQPPSSPPPTSTPATSKQKKSTPSAKKTPAPTQPTPTPTSPTPNTEPPPTHSQPLIPKFRTNDHAEFFSEEIQKRPVVIERKFLISEADCFPLDLEGNKSRNEVCIQVADEIKWRKWEALCNIKAPAYELLVKQFYSNMKIHDDEDEYSTEVLGIPIDFSPSVLNSLCDTALPETIECFYDKNKDKELPFEEMNEVLCDGGAEWNINPPVPGKVRYLERSSLNLKSKLWCAFLIGVLMPIMHSNTLTKRRLWCLFALMKKEPIDIGLLIAREMIEARNTKNISLPYAKVISVLLFKNGIPLRFYQQSFGKGDINTSYFNQYIFGLPPKKSKPPTTHAPTQPSSSQTRELPTDQEQRMQQIETSLGSCKAELADIKAHLAKQDEKMETLHADVRKCLMLLLGKPVASYVSPRPEQSPLVDAAMIETEDAEPSEDELRKDTGDDEEEGDKALGEHIGKIVQGIVDTATTSTSLLAEPILDPSSPAALDILVDTSLTSEPMADSKKRKRDAAEPDS